MESSPYLVVSSGIGSIPYGYASGFKPPLLLVVYLGVRMEDIASEEHQWSLAAPFIFFVVLAFHLASQWIDQFKKSGSDNEKEAKLHVEIKELLKEANSLSQPSTFAQGAKLKRLAAAKEKELAKCQNLHNKDTALYSKSLLISKVLTYLILLAWFWSVPVACISQQLVQPFGRFLSWRTGGIQNDNIIVGIIPWLIVSTRFDLGFPFSVIAALDPYRLPPSTEAPFARPFSDLGNMYGPRGAMLGSGGVSDGYEVGSKRQRMMESNPYFAVSSGTGSLPYGYAGGFQPPPFPVVRLRGLPFNCTDIDILKFFAGLTIVDVLLVNKSGRFSGEAFVVFAGAMQVEFALQRDRQNMGRRYVEVFRCKKQDYYNAVAAEINYEGIYDNDYHGSSPPPSRSKRFSDKDQMEYTEILKMRGLPFQVTKSQIVEFFKDFNLIEDRVHIACRPDGKATGEAYVEFVSAEEAKRAMSKDKMTIGSRYVELFPSTPDEARRAESRSRQ
ncbi:unnamed protein product [Sphenostylis stenocarpa]|uniref:RRM domain-containing protein n=3 Tax=Phaseoleae TaxID=163735 RepID=A0AA86VXP8_9FABA|nr:unnamed protein product [Sphenostylis stenocarpa]